VCSAEGRPARTGNFLRRLALPQSVKHWWLTTLKEKLVKIGAKVVTHARYVTFQMADVAMTVFAEMETVQHLMERCVRTRVNRAEGHLR